MAPRQARTLPARKLEPVCILKYNTGQRKALYRLGRQHWMGEWLGHRGPFPQTAFHSFSQGDLRWWGVVEALRSKSAKVEKGVLPKELASAVKAKPRWSPTVRALLSKK